MYAVTIHFFGWTIVPVGVSFLLNAYHRPVATKTTIEVGNARIEE